MSETFLSFRNQYVGIDFVMGYPPDELQMTVRAVCIKDPDRSSMMIANITNSRSLGHFFIKFAISSTKQVGSLLSQQPVIVLSVLIFVVILQYLR